MQPWPAAMSGLDLIGVAPTGSGKTFAYLLPALTHITAQLKKKKLSADDGPIATVIAPTRELASQIQEEAHSAFRSCLLIGGQSSKFSVLVIGCPGRIIDLLLVSFCFFCLGGIF